MRLAVFIALLIVTTLTGAPLPVRPPAKPVPVRADGRATAADLRAVRWLVWAGHRWPIRLEVETGEGYSCRHHDPSARTVWSGSAALDGGDLCLEQSEYYLADDAPPELQSGPTHHRFPLGWRGGRLVGTGWGQPFELTR